MLYPPAPTGYTGRPADMHHFPHKPLSLLILSALLLFGSGCMETRVVSSSWDQWRKLEWYEPTSEEVANGHTRQANRGYTVELATFTGDDAFSKVYRVITAARQHSQLADLWYASAGRQTKVYAGRFRERDGSEARATLREARDIRIDGRRLFDDPEVVAITSARTEVIDKHDLRSLSNRGLYTLQIGYYDSAFGSDYRKAAEDRVEALREQDEEAYYYHGPNRSMILINTWTYGEAFMQVIGRPDRYSNVVRSVQEQYPHNIPNGQPFTDEDDPSYIATQHSFIVPIR